jgi:hypothetical protein
MDFAQKYRDMPAHRLAQLAADENNLVPEAREALRAEIALRSLQIARRPQSVEESASARDPLDGVGGWLAWFCLGLFGGAYSQIRLAFSLRGGIASIMLAFAVFSLGIAAWDLATGISLMLRTRSALKMISIHLIAGALQGTIIMAEGIAVLAFTHGSAKGAMLWIASGLSACGGYAIWFKYFQVSKRVKITFGRNL